MEAVIYDIIDHLEEDERNTLLYMISRKTENPNSDEVALYFGGEMDLFITIEGEVVEVKIKDAKYSIDGQKLLKKYR